MKTIVAGSRGIDDYQVVQKVIDSAPWQITEVVSGGARGVDRLGERWAREHRIAVMLFAAEWGRLGKKAGVLRNEQMARYAEALIAVWDRSSRGTRHMILRATELGLRVLVASPTGEILFVRSQDSGKGNLQRALPTGDTEGPGPAA